MIHTYRNPQVFRSKAFGLAVWVFLVLLLASSLGSDRPFIWFDAVGLALCIGGLVLACFLYRNLYYRDCGEIRLSDGGTCEFETKRRLIRLDVSEIRSVRCGNPEYDSEHYAIHYQGGKLGVTKQMTDFPDFLARLKALNPALDLISFPDAWPGPGERTPEKLGPVNRFFSALFPLIAVSLSLLVYLESFVGK